MDLKKSVIYRSGGTGPDKRESSRPSVVTGKRRGSVGIWADIPSKGGGTTFFTVDIPRSDYHRVIAQMLSVDREYTLKAIDKALTMVR